MNELRIFENQDFGQIRTVEQDRKPWFVAADVCRALDIVNHKDALTRLDDDEKMGVALTDPHGREQVTNCVNEPGLYALVLGSRKPEAKAFKRWITHEVLPSLRRHGAYATGETIDKILEDPEFGIRLLGKLKEEREQRKALEERAEQDAPKVLFARSVECSGSAILIGELAKILKQNGVNIGQNRLFEMLRRDGFLVARQGSDRNMPTQRSMEMGLMRIKETAVTHADGHVTVSRTPKVTGKGQVYFVNRYMGEAGRTIGRPKAD